MTAVRRSTREKRKASSIYDEAKKQVEARQSVLAKPVRKSKDLDEEDKEESEVENGIDSGDNSSSNSDSDDDVEPLPNAAVKSPKSQALVKSPQAPKLNQIKLPKVTVKTGKKKEGDEKTSKVARGEVGVQRAKVVRALTLLEKKVRTLWQEGENSSSASKEEDNSLVFSLLGAAAKGSQRGGRAPLGDDETIYTPQLEQIARQIINEHKLDSTKALIKLVNLLFRSVGGSPATDLSEDDHLDLTEEEWDDAINIVVEEMCHTPESAVLFCADPEGAVHAATEESSPASFGAREYRKIYEEFWYVLGRVALSEGTATKITTPSESDESGDEDSPPRSSLFEVEQVREIIVKMTELITVGQPDIRAGATIAVLQLGLAAIKRTVAMGAKLDVAVRQLNASHKGKKQMHRKADGLSLQIDSLKRTRAELEEIVASLLFPVVFSTRYRDSNMHIRAFALQWLSRLTIMRPDIFLMDKYFKYLGWMLSDKAPSVRLASIRGFLAPLKAAKSASSSGTNGSKANKLDLSSIENVVKKFLPRIADCVIDVDILVQEAAMELLLALLQEGLMEDCDDSHIWHQVNLRAMDPATSLSVRRNALYFVIEQLSPFQVEDSLSQPVTVSDKVKAARLDSIASWVAHNLSDGEIPPEQMRIGLADLIVRSLLEMPEHKDLVSDLTIVLGAIKELADAISRVGKDLRRVEATKQRVLLQMLACAANAEVLNADFLASDADVDVLMAKAHFEGAKQSSIKKKRTGKWDVGVAHEANSVALLKVLADFFLTFKGDVPVLKSLTALPLCLLPSVISRPSHKDDFVALMKRLSNLYLETSDEQVLENIACSLTFFARGDHARSAEAHLQLKDLTNSLKDRLISLSSFEQHSKSGGVRPVTSAATSDSSHSSSSVASNEEAVVALDTEYSLSICLKRLRVLSKRCNLGSFLEVAVEETVEGSKIEAFCTSIALMTKTRLDERQVRLDAQCSEPIVPATWTTCDKRIHELVAVSVNEALLLILSIIAWQTSVAVKSLEGVFVADETESDSPEVASMDEDVDHIVLRLRGDIVKLLQLCWEQSLDGFDLSLFSEAQIEFSDLVQLHACNVSGDLRSLFPKEWVDSPSSLLRAFALTDDGLLVAGSVRYLRSRAEELRSRGDQSDLAKSLLLPLCRGLTPNWANGNRREAGAILAHVAFSGDVASDIVSAMSRVLKKIEPLRLLESHMACLRQSYEDWLDCEPEELESDRPSEEEMEAYEENEKKHVKMFDLMTEQADRLSKSLGVGKLSDPKLSPAILAFFKEGIRFAFSNDDELTFGTRLYFLRILGRYAFWVRKNQSQLKVVQAVFTEWENELKAHDEFLTLSTDMLDAVDGFKEYIDIKQSIKLRGSPRTPVEDSVTSPQSDEKQLRSTLSPHLAAVSIRRRMSHTSSVSSKRSRMSAQSSLSPLYEEDGVEDDVEDDEMSSSVPSKRRKITERSRAASLGSLLSVSTMGRTQATIDEGSGEHSDESS